MSSEEEEGGNDLWLFYFLNLFYSFSFSNSNSLHFITHIHLLGHVAKQSNNKYYDYYHLYSYNTSH